MNTRIWLELPADQIYNPVLRQGVEVNLEIAGFIRLHYVEIQQELYADRSYGFKTFHFERHNARWMAEMLRVFADWDKMWEEDRVLTCGGDTLRLSDQCDEKPMTVYLTNDRAVEPESCGMALPRRMARMLSEALLAVVEGDAHTRELSPTAALSAAEVAVAPVSLFKEIAYAPSIFGTAQWRELTEEQKTQARVPGYAYVGVGCGIASDGEVELLRYQIGSLPSRPITVGWYQCLRCERDCLSWIVRTLWLILGTKHWLPVRRFGHGGRWDRLRIERKDHVIAITNHPRGAAPYAVPAGAACERDPGREHYRLRLTFAEAEVFVEFLQQQMEDNPALRPWWKRAFSRES